MSTRFGTVFRTECAGFISINLSDDIAVPSGGIDVTAMADSTVIPCGFNQGGSPNEIDIVFPLVRTGEYRFLIQPPEAEGADRSDFEMRLPSFALTWLSRVNWRLNRSACLAMRERAEASAAGGLRIEELQVLEHGDGDNAIRFSVTGSARNVRLGEMPFLVFAAHDVPRPHRPIEIDRIATAGDEVMRVFTVVVPKGSFALCVTDEHRFLAPLTSETAHEIIAARNAAMVNPTIDDRYPQVAEAADAQDDPRTIAARIGALGLRPLISIVCPLYNTPSEYLSDMLGSVIAQNYPDWELVLVNSTPENEAMRTVLDRYDDNRIREMRLERNLGIVGNTNAGIAVAKGDWIGFLDHDDMLAEHALAHYAFWMNDHPDDDVLYCDEDGFEVAGGERFAPLLKPDFNRDLLYTHNYIIHFLMAKRPLIERIERATADVEGVQDYDLILKALEQGARFGHVPRILYYWRQHAGSTAGGAVGAKPESEAAGARAIAAHFKRTGIDASVEVTDIPFVYRTTYHMEGALAHTVAVVVDHGQGAAKRLLASLAPLQSRGLAIVAADVGADRPDGSATWGACVNAALASAEDRPYAVVISDAVLFDDSLVAEAPFGSRGDAGPQTREAAQGACDAIETLVSYLQREDVGVASAKLFYADGLVAHAGLCVKPDGSLGYLNQNFAPHMGGGYHGFAECDCDYSAVGPDFFAFRTSAFDEVGGFGEYGGNALATVADFCFKMRLANRVALVSPEACAHACAPVIWEGRPGGASLPWSADNPEIAKLWRAWGANPSFADDVLANPLITLDRSYPQLNTAISGCKDASSGSGPTRNNKEEAMPRVSVVIPIYNAQPYLRQCLESIRTQTLADIEVLCVNDGSTDDSLDVIEEFARLDPRFIVLDKPNGGYGQALNYGIARATGEFISVIEPDDFIDQTMYEQLCLLADFEGEPADIVKGSYWEFYDGRDGFGDQLIPPPLAELMDPVPFAFDVEECDTVLLHHPSIWSAIYRRSFLEAEGIRFIEPKGAGWADNPFFLETLIAAKRIVWAPKGYYYYRQTNPNASSLLKDYRMPFERLRDLFEIIERRNASDVVKGAVYHRAFTYIDSIIGDFGFHEADPDLQRLIDETLAAMDHDFVYACDEITLEQVAFYEARMNIPLPNGNDPVREIGSDDPVITYLIPLLDNAQHVDKAIASILAQPIDAFEALFVNCGSTDRTADLCSRQTIHDPRFRFVEANAEQPGEALNTALDQARGAFMFIVDLNCRLLGNAFSHALLLAAEHDLDLILLDSEGRHAIDALHLSGSAKPHGTWGAGEARTLLTEPFDPAGASAFALNCGRPTSRTGLYRMGLLRDSGTRFSDTDLVYDRRFLAHALAAAHRAAYLGGPFQERIYEQPPWVHHHLDIRMWHDRQQPLTLEGALTAADDPIVKERFALSALNAVLEAFIEDVSTRRVAPSLEEYVEQNLPKVNETLAAAPEGLWFHDGKAHSDWQLLREKGVKGYCEFYYLVRNRDAIVELEFREGLASSRTYKLGEITRRIIKTVTPAKFTEFLRSTQARNM